ncbi:argininosuccinate synthase [Alkalibaculum sp. M08DMB]|uniref:Argininosuccinate synthase n=1 Tax=Alkalibaculum sporogenes TaxID=2655001 RepID=A0A6A7KAT9_9FIRM|nr:argininosuccinate synthase [Alkalibaculum sporogenes]MPW26638.1 argininosuccinate synthase [Alkalibaculum sporogenes]
MKEKVILAYSGGLDTTTIIPWLKENYDYEVIAVCIDVGQGQEIDGLEERAISSGASKLYIDDVREEFVQNYVYPTMKAGAVYENKYLLGTSIARPLIAQRLVHYALLEGAVAICHGATGKGNDQVRFELTMTALAPHLKIIAPWRIWDIKSREDAITYCLKHDIKLNMKKDTSYSRDRNLWHVSHEGLELEDPSIEPDLSKILQMSNTIENAPNEAEYVELEFEKGIPIKLNGKELNGNDMITALNEIGGKHAIGVIDLVENRIVGMKSRGVYETPGGTILYRAHEELEHLCLDKQTYSYKQTLSIKYAELVYSGEWFTPLREALEAFVETTQESISGVVKLKLFKGNIISAGATSPNSLYNEEIASFTTGDLYDHKDAEGFIRLFGLPLRVRALMKMQKNQP